jgi:hypothetical protein
VNQEILAEINTYIKQYGKEKGYDFILGATDNGNIVYAAEGKDITDDVLAGSTSSTTNSTPLANENAAYCAMLLGAAAGGLRRGTRRRPVPGLPPGC